MRLMMLFVFLGLMADAVRPADAAPSVCADFGSGERAVCERGERDFPQWRALRDNTCEQTEEEKARYAWSQRFAEICRRAFIYAIQVELLEPEDHFQVTVSRDKYSRFIGVAVTRRLLQNGEPLPEELSKDLQRWTTERLKVHREGYRDDNEPDGQFGSVAIEYLVAQAGISWIDVSAINANYGEWYYIEGAPHGQWFGISKLYDRSTGRFVESLDELFTNSERVIDIVSKIVIEELTASDYQPRDEELINSYVREPAHWQFSDGKLEIAFSPYSLGPYIPAYVKPIPLTTLARYIKKDGPLGRSLNRR